MEQEIEDDGSISLTDTCETFIFDHYTREGAKHSGYYTFIDSAVTYADSALQKPLESLPLHASVVVDVSGSYPDCFVAEQPVVRVFLRSGDTAYMRGRDIGAGIYWVIRKQAYFCIAGYPPDAESRTALVQIYHQTRLLQEMKIYAPHAPMPVDPLTVVNSQSLASPLYMIYTGSGFGAVRVPTVVHLLCFVDGRFQYLTRRVSHGEPSGYAVYCRERLDSEGVLTFLQHTWSTNPETANPPEGGEYGQDTTYLSEKLTYTWGGKRYEQTDSVPAITRVLWRDSTVIW